MATDGTSEIKHVSSAMVVKVPGEQKLEQSLGVKSYFGRNLGMPLIRPKIEEGATGNFEVFFREISINFAPTLAKLMHRTFCICSPTWKRLSK